MTLTLPLSKHTSYEEDIRNFKPIKKYLLAQYIKKPRDPKQTSNKEYMADSKNFQFDEIISFTSKLKDKDMIESWVILDLDTKEIIKSRTDHKKPEEMYEYFYKTYNDSIDQFVRGIALQEVRIANAMVEKHGEKMKGDEENINS